MRKIAIALLFSSLSTTAVAQDRQVVVQPSTEGLSTINAPIEYDANGVAKAQYFRAEDLTPEQLQALLAEADKVRNYQRATGASTAHQPQTTYSPEIEIYTQPTQGQTYSSVTQPVAQGRIHRVAKGDTLYNVSRRYGVSVSDLQAANGIAGSYISIGQTLRIPAVATPSSTAPSVAFIGQPVQDGLVTRRVVQPVPDDMQSRNVDQMTTQIYAVLPKDTLYSISRRTCVGVADLIAVNGISNPDALKPGQRLTLPDGHCLTY